MNKIMLSLAILFIGIALGYAWAAHCYLPHIEQLLETIRHLDNELITIAFNTYVSNTL